MRRAPVWYAVGFAVALGCSSKPTEPAPPAATPTAATPDPAVRYEESFSKAVTDEVGRDQLPPPDRTVAGKSTAEIRDTVERLWPTIQIADKAGQPILWLITLETETGPVEITLRPDLAPNHVRNFIALVQAGYYDELRFDRIVNQFAEAPDGTRSDVKMVRFGCPAGTGDPGIGHIGYRLRSEFSDEKHVTGTVGFTRDNDPNSGGTRLYISLAPAPALDNNFTIVGKVSKGLEVLEQIAAGKLLPPDLDPARELPERPVTIRRATANRIELTTEPQRPREDK